MESHLSPAAPSEWTRVLTEVIRTACVWEVTARKPGNVHPQAAFADVCFEDFVRSAEVAAPVLAEARSLGVGRAIREAVSVTRRAVGCNTNLGIVLLLAPLAAVPEGLPLRAGIEDVLARLTIEDARECYAAIREAQPGGLGRAAKEDVADAPSVTLREAMQLAADRDRIAAQYANGFDDVLVRGLGLLETPRRFPFREGEAPAEPPLQEPAARREPRPPISHGLLETPQVEHWTAARWEQAVVLLHVRLMAELPDTLIARKCGSETAHEASARAGRVLDAGWPHTSGGRDKMADFDRWLRSDGHRRNPGTTADLVAAILFAALRDKQIAPPRT